MNLDTLLKEKNMSKYRLAKISDVPYTTINDICRQKAQIEKCTAETIYKIAAVLDVSVESLIAPHIVKRSSFDIFKSNVCHRVIAFIISTLETDEISQYFERKWYAESFYLLAMLDYLSRRTNLPLCSRYNDIRKCKLQKTVYPSSVLMAAAVSPKGEKIKKSARQDSIPEFIRFNIVESEVQNVI